MPAHPGQIHHKIAVVGAGIMGLGAARALREKGHEITLYDAQDQNAPSNASAMAGGMLAPYAEIDHLPPAYLPAALAGIDFWENFAPAKETGFQRNGSLIVAHEEDFYILERFTHKLQTVQNTPFIGRAEITALEPGLGKFRRGIFLSAEAHINPARAMDILRRDLNIISNAAHVNALRQQFDFVIDCRGCGAAEDDKDLRGVKGETVIVRNPEFSLSRPVRLMHPRYPLYITPRSGNQFMIGATLIESADETTSLKSAMELLSAAYSLHASFAEAEIIDFRAGIRPAYPDNLPRITVEENVIRCNGLFRHGYLLSPVMAKCAADYIAGAENEFSHLFMRGTDDRHHQRPEEKYRRRA